MKIKSNDLLMLLSWYYGKELIKAPEKEFKYMSLYSKLLYSDSKELIYIDNDTIKEIMTINYEFYKKVTDNENEAMSKIKILSEQIGDKKIIDIGNEMLKEFKIIYEKISFKYPLNFKFQKVVLEDLMTDSIKTENFEMCAKLRDKIKELS